MDSKLPNALQAFRIDKKELRPRTWMVKEEKSTKTEVVEVRKRARIARF